MSGRTDYTTLMQDRPAWNAADLATVMGMTAELLRKRVLFWISHGVLQETRTTTGMVGTLHQLREDAVVVDTVLWAI